MRNGIVKFCLTFVLFLTIGTTAANACSCPRYFDEASATAGRSAMTEKLAREATIIRGIVTERIDRSRRAGELIRVEETLVGESRKTVRIWRPFTEAGMSVNSCTNFPSQSIEPVLSVLLPLNETEILTQYAERPTPGGALVANAPSEEFFEPVGYCDMMGADLDAIVERAQALGRAP